MDDRNIYAGPSGKNTESDSAQNKKLKVGAGIVLAVLAVCVVAMAAKSFFIKDTDIPEGVYTGTINTDQSEQPAKEANADANNKKNESKAETTATESSAEESSAVESNETAYVNQYAYLREKPEQEGKEIVCMSPNIEVTVLEKLENGYWKVTFMNIDGQKTGYVWNEYLQSADPNQNGE